MATVVVMTWRSAASRFSSRWAASAWRAASCPAGVSFWPASSSRSTAKTARNARNFAIASGASSFAARLAGERRGFEVAADELAPLRFHRSRREIDRRDVQRAAQTGRHSRRDRMAFVRIPLVATRKEKRRHRGIGIEGAGQPVHRGIDLARGHDRA